jgi:hypothetical protein
MTIRNRFRGTTPVGQWLRGGAGSVTSVQRNTITIASGATTNTATLSPAVDPDRCRLKILGRSAPTADAATAAAVRLTFTNGTTITATVNATGSGDRIVAFEVIEYATGAIRSIQRGTATGATQAISAVVPAKTEVDYLGFTTNAASPGMGEAFARVRLQDATTVAVDGAAATRTVGFQVVEWV